MSRVTAKNQLMLGVSRVNIVSNEKVPIRVLISALIRSRGRGPFNVFNKGFMQVAMFEKISESRVKRFFHRAQEEPNRKRARAPLPLMI